MARIRAIALDVDGVLTDGGIWWGPDGGEWKRLCFVDIMGLSLARKAGLIVALISGEDSRIVDRLAGKIGITDVVKNCKDKGTALREFARRHHLTMDEICFMGDDVNDLRALEASGLAAAPADARPIVLAKCQFIAKAGGGHGAVRELVDTLLADAAAGHADSAVK